MFVVGTAGHIDHGKSTLIRTLTGVDPDRLQEEKQRGMTIDLGFASMTLASGKQVGFLDVPGHHRFIRNMVAGVGNIDLTLFVVSATEGWMPQSQEHLEVIELFGIKRALIVLSKCDRIEDEEWLDMVEDDIRERIAHTSLASAPIIRVSSTTGLGLDSLQQALEHHLQQMPDRIDHGRPRLWIDRAFTIHGAGTVVTGTLAGGSLHNEQHVVLQPLGQEVRIRQLQIHNEQVQYAPPGTRLAVNLSGASLEDVRRGMAIVGHRQTATQHAHAILRLVKSWQQPLPGIFQCYAYFGTAETQATVRVLGADEIRAGQNNEVLVQVSVEDAIAAEIGDRFVLRDVTKGQNIGGGTVLDADPTLVRRKSLRYILSDTESVAGSLHQKYFDPEALYKRRQADGKYIIEHIVNTRGCLTQERIVQQLPIREEQTKNMLATLAKEKRIIVLEPYVVSSQAWETLKQAVLENVEAYHNEYPMRYGPSQEQIRSQLNMKSSLFHAVSRELSKSGYVQTRDGALCIAGREVALNDKQRQARGALLQQVEEQGVTPPTLEELIAAGYDEEFINWLIRENELVLVGNEFVYSPKIVQHIKQRVAKHIEQHDYIDVKTLRNVLGTSRKYALPLLEYFDSQHFTRRVGDKRFLA